jgi:GTP-binding protein
LLNALLYGNRTFAADYSATDHANKKGQTPRQVMLPKGCKAVTSPRPGETRDITFYQLAASKSAKNHDRDASSSSSSSSLLLWLVDLPGFGFAHGNEQAKDMYQQLVTHYLLGLLKSNPRGSSTNNNSTITAFTGNKPKRILLLLDARHGMKKADLDFLEMLQKQQQQILQSGSPAKSRKIITTSLIPPIQLVLTKCDLVTQTDLARRVVQVREQFNDVMMRETSQLPILLVSARAGVGYNNRRNEHDAARGGILELQKDLASLAAVDVPMSSSSTTTTALRNSPSRPRPTMINSIQATKRPRGGRIGTRPLLQKMSNSRKVKR